MTIRLRLLLALLFFALPPALACAGGGHGGGGGHEETDRIPRALDSYEDPQSGSIIETLKARAAAEPFNLVATIIFFCAIIHTFIAPKLMRLAHQEEELHRERIAREQRTAMHKPYDDAKDDVSFKAQALHFLGEVEAVFGIWVAPLLLAMFFMHDMSWAATASFLDSVHYTEPMFVVVIMAISSTRPALKFAESCLRAVASLGGKSAEAWWLSILTVTPLLGSFITEPAAMTIAALLLGKLFYRHNPSPKLKYATLGLLFVNVSVGGTLTHFAAPPVLMVAARWGWDMQFMFMNFGWKAALGVFASTFVYWLIFRKELGEISRKAASTGEETATRWHDRDDPVPAWITLAHLGFIGWTVFNLHHPPLFIGGFLFFLAFTIATEHHQNAVNIKGPLLVGFFLAGLVTHGALQAWWIAPTLSALSELPLFAGATILTAFNDNAAITFLASQVPDFSDALKYAVVAGAVTGGGLTVIANAPNPAGQSILSRYFNNGVSPLALTFGAAIPTLILALCFLLLPRVG